MVTMTVDVTDEVLEVDRSFSDVDRAILEFERLRFGNPGVKDQHVLERFDMTPTKYRHRLAWIIDQPEAAAYDATNVARLLRLREQRRALRAGQPAGETFVDRRGLRPGWL